jgi:hypothetical protein
MDRHRHRNESTRKTCLRNAGSRGERIYPSVSGEVKADDAWMIVTNRAIRQVPDPGTIAMMELFIGMEGNTP